MAPRGRKGATAACSSKELLAEQNGLLKAWLDTIESKVQAQKEVNSQRRPGKDIEVGNSSTGNGPHACGFVGHPSTGTGLPVNGSVGRVSKENGLLAKGLIRNALKFINSSDSLVFHMTGSSSQVHHVRSTGNEEARSKNGKGKSENSKGSWADKVHASSAKSRFCLDGDLVQEHGREVYSLPYEFIEEDFGDWTRCLVGFIPGSPFSFYVARAIALREWKHYGIETVYTYGGFFIFRFQNKEKVHEVLADEPWLFGGKFMMLQ